MDQLRDAIKKVLGPQPEPPAAPPDELPDPLRSDWVARMRALGADIPKDPSWGQLTQRSDKLVKELKAAGRGRESAELRSLAEEFAKARANKAWALVKARFAELDLPERTYRSLKQEDADPIKVVAKLRGAKGEALRGTGAQKLRDLLA